MPEQAKQTILAVDDTPENLDVVKSVLAPDYAVKAAVNGKMALKIARAQSPDLILLDIMMPEMDGYEVCKRLKADRATRDIPVIFLTALNQVGDEARGFKLGAVDFIAKPVVPAIVRARVKTHLALSEARKKLENHNLALIEAAQLREDVEHITRHDLKSPLNAIIGVPQYLLGQCRFTESQKSLVLGIEQAGLRMLEMINMSLDLFKMENGAYLFAPEPVDIYELLQKVFGDIESSAQKKQLELRILIDGRPAGKDRGAVAMAEPLLCYSMFANLCKNAIEASGEGDLFSINIVGGQKTEIVFDNAGEVPESIRDTFFEKFVTKGKDYGTGLGTYSARLMAETQNGEISLDTSAPGRTRIRVVLDGGEQGNDGG